MFITADQVFAHLVGDYVLQSDWMANEKSSRNLAALAHGFCYALPFLFFKPSVAAFVVIVVSHYIIDHLKLARYVCWAKNFLAPKETLQLGRKPAFMVRWWYSWKECEVTGYSPETPSYLAAWLLIIVDNLLHVAINAAALRWL